MFKYIENIVAFSREAFDEAYKQGVASGEESLEMDLTCKTYEYIKELESEGKTVEMVMVGFEKIIILYGGGMYKMIQISQK